MVLLMNSHVLGQLVDSFRQQGDLNFRGAGVGILASELLDDLGLAFLRTRHRAPRCLRRTRLLPGCRVMKRSLLSVGEQFSDEGRGNKGSDEKSEPITPRLRR